MLIDSPCESVFSMLAVSPALNVSLKSSLYFIRGFFLRKRCHQSGKFALLLLMRSHKGLKQHAVQLQILGLPEFLNADRHAEMPGRRLVLVGAKQSIPPGQIEAEVAVGFVTDNRMMNAMHVWRNHEQAQPAVDFARQAD